MVRQALLRRRRGEAVVRRCRTRSRRGARQFRGSSWCNLNIGHLLRSWVARRLPERFEAVQRINAGTVRAMAIPVERCIVSRDLTEPRLSPDGRCIVYAMAAGGAAALMIDSARRLARASAHCLSAAAPGSRFRRRMLVLDRRCERGDLRGGRRRPVVAAGADGGCSSSDQSWARANCCCTGAVADGTRVVYVVDEAEVWVARLDDGSADRLDDGSADFVFDPSADAGRPRVMWQGWNVPDMPWDRARVQRARFAASQGRRPAGRLPRSSRSGRCPTERSCACATTTAG